MSDLKNELYKSKIYQIVYSFGGLRLYPLTTLLCFALNMMLGLIIGMVISGVTSNVQTSVMYMMFVQIIYFNVILFFGRLPTRCRHDSIQSLKRSELEQFGVCKTDSVMQYILFDLLYIDVYKSVLTSVICKFIVTVVVAYLSYALYQYVNELTTLYTILIYIGITIVNIFYTGFVLEIDD